LLISTEEIPQEIKTLNDAIYFLPKMSPTHLKKLILVHFDIETNEFKDWFESNPFKENSA
jgi:hypothetical protein